MRLDGKGFALVEVALVILALAVVGLAGWMWWQADRGNEMDSGPETGTTETAQERESREEPETPEGWEYYEDDLIGVSFMYPGEWERPNVKAEDITSYTNNAGIRTGYFDIAETKGRGLLSSRELKRCIKKRKIASSVTMRI